MVNNNDNIDPLRICLVTDIDYLNGYNLPDLIDAVLRSGVSMVRLTQNDMTPKEFYLTAQQIKGITDRFKVPLVIQDRVDVALAVDAAGVHLDSRSFPVSRARKLFPEGLIGYTIEKMLDLDDAHAAEVDYIELFSTFQSSSLPDSDRLWETEGIDMLLYRTDLPVLAGGGVNKDNIAAAAESGAAGVAISAALMSSTRPLDSAEELVSLFNAARSAYLAKEAERKVEK